MNKFAFPGFFFCTPKTHPKGNKLYTIFCGESGIVYCWDIVYVRGHTIPMGIPEFDTNSKTRTVGIVILLN